MTRRTTTVIVMSVICFVIGMLVYNPQPTQHGTSDQWRIAPSPVLSDGHGNTWRTAFVRGYQARMGEVDPAVATDLIGHAAGVCAYLEVDPSLPDVWTWGTDNAGMSSDQAVAVIEEAIKAKCPQHLHLLEGE